MGLRGACTRHSFRQPFDPLGLSEVGHWLCVPGSRRVCFCRGAGALVVGPVSKATSVLHAPLWLFQHAIGSQASDFRRFRERDETAKKC